MAAQLDAETQKMAQAGQGFFSQAAKFTMEGDVSRLKSHTEDFMKRFPQCSAQDIFMDFHTEGKRLVHLAASGGKKDVFEYILSNCPNKVDVVNIKDINDFTPLIYATISESMDIIKVILNISAHNVNHCNKDGAGAVHYAAGDGSVERLKILRGAGCKFDQVSTSGGAPLHWAAGDGRADAIAYLIKEKVDVNLPTNEGIPAIIMAASASCDLGVKYLVEAQADIGMILAGNLTTLHICAENGMVEAVRSMVMTETGKKCATIATDDGNWPIHLAAMTFKTEVIRVLIPQYRLSGGGGAVEAKSGSDEDLIEALLLDGKERMQKWEANEEQKKIKKNEIKSEVDEGVPVDLTKEVGEDKKKEAETFKETGNAFYTDRKYDEAIAAYTNGIECNPKNEFIWSNRSACYLAVKQPNKALRDAEICRRLVPDWTKGCYRLASARLALGEYEDAAVAAFEGCKIDDQNKELKTLLKLAVKKGQDEHKAKLEASQKS